MGIVGKIVGLPTWAKVTLLSMSVVGLLILVLIGVAVAFLITAWFGQPIPVLGFQQTFEQPIDFPHTIHAGMEVRVDDDGNPLLNADGEMLAGIGLDCLFCHRTVDDGASAGVPAVQLCAHCHGVVGAEDNEALVPLREVAGITDGGPVQVIDWRRVHRLPDHVRFAHQPHIDYLTTNPSVIVDASGGEVDPAISNATFVMPSAVCSTCHGDVASMEQIFQVAALKMRQCVACHRANGAPTSCETCHY